MIRLLTLVLMLAHSTAWAEDDDSAGDDDSAALAEDSAWGWFCDHRGRTAPATLAVALIGLAAGRRSRSAFADRLSRR